MNTLTSDMLIWILKIIKNTVSTICRKLLVCVECGGMTSNLLHQNNLYCKCLYTCSYTNAMTPCHTVHMEHVVLTNDPISNIDSHQRQI